MTGSYSISTSRMMPKRSPVRKCWVRVLWTMFQYAEVEFTRWDHAVPVAQEQVNENAVTRGERTAKGAIVDATRTARGATVLQDARSDLGRAARLLAHIERTLGAQTKLAIDRDALAGADLAVRNLGWLARRGKAAKDLGAHQQDLGPRTLASLDQRAVVIVEPVILAALAHQTGAYHDLHFHPSQAKRPI